LGPDGNLWFTELKSNQIGEIDATTHAVSEYAIPTSLSFPFGITAGPDGNLWFTEAFANQIGEINPATHAISEYSIPTADSIPVMIAAGPDGNLWFTESKTNQIGEINPTTHTISEYPVPTANGFVGGITAGPDGNLWFAEKNANKIGAINPATHVITEYATPTLDSGPLDITSGPDGNLWFTENKAGRIGAMNPATHVITEYALSAAGVAPSWITSGPDGNLWFSEMNNNEIGTINPTTHAVTEFPIPTPGSSPGAITSGPGGTVWFAAAGTNQIGEIVVAPGITANAIKHTVDAGQTTTFTAAAQDATTPLVQWRVSTDQGLTFHALTNNGTYSGVSTGTLTITGATTSLSGDEYKAIFSASANPNATAATSAATLTVKPALSITPALPQGTAGRNYKHTITVSGGSMPFTSFTVTGFDAGSTGLAAGAITTNSAAGTVTINGTPDASGTATFTVMVTDTAGATLSKAFTITINPMPTIGALTTTQWTAGESGFTGTMTIAGGTGPFVVTGYGGLPVGLVVKLSGSTISFTGTPSTSGIFSHGTITIQDATGARVTQPLGIIINSRLAVTNLTATQWTVGEAGFSGTMTIGGGTGTVIIVASSGLPTGLTATVSGRTISFTGTPSVAGTFAGGNITVEDAVGARVTRAFSITINAPPILSSLSVTQWTQGRVHFAGTLRIVGGTGPFFINGGAGFPTGLTASVTGRTIVFNGLPGTAGMFSAGSVTVQDAAGATFTQTFAITINPPLAITTTSLPTWTEGMSYMAVVQATGGTGAVSFAVGSGSLPPGLTLSRNGKITGVTMASGSFRFTVSATDAVGATASESYTIS